MDFKKVSRTNKLIIIFIVVVIILFSVVIYKNFFSPSNKNDLTNQQKNRQETKELTDSEIEQALNKKSNNQDNQGQEINDSEYVENVDKSLKKEAPGGNKSSASNEDLLEALNQK